MPLAVDIGMLGAIQAGKVLPNTLPALAGSKPTGDVFVGDVVAFGVRASDADGDALNVRLTFYGVPPR